MVAIRTDSTLGTNFTQASLIAAIKTAMLAAGFSNPIDDYTSGTDRYLVYAFVVDASKTYGTVYYRIRVNTSFAIMQATYSSWNVTTHSGNNTSGELLLGSALSNTNTVSFVCLNGGSEYKFIFLVQSSIFIPMGLISPAIKPNWWDLNQWNYVFQWGATGLNSLLGTTLNPYANNTYPFFMNDSRLSAINSQTNAVDIMSGVILFTTSTRGIAGKTSDDLGSACVSASSRYNTIASDTPNQNYLIINPVAGGLVIKVQA